MGTTLAKRGSFIFTGIMAKHPIGVFDSGYGGLTILKELVNKLPEYDFIYLGDNARSPYGSRSFQTVYQYTWQSVQWFFKMGCPLVILACNTASAKALRNIQQNNLQQFPGKKVLGVIRPTTELIGNYSTTGHVGILGTQGTVQSNSYPIEIAKFYPELQVYQQACPIWVPLVENNEYNNPGADYFISKYLEELLQQSPSIDTLLLACTHYPILIDHIKKFLPGHINILSQGPIVANSLIDYLQRHPEVESLCTKGQTRQFFTTDQPADFNSHASIFYGKPVEAIHVEL